MTRQYPNANLIRRFAAMLYDSFLIVAIWMITTTIIVVGFNNDEKITGPFFQALLLFELFLFYFVFWRIKGQSLGMQVWKIKLIDAEGNIVSGRDAGIRFMLALVSTLPLGAGFFWMLFDPERLAFHDRYSHTRVVYLGTRPYESEKINQA